MGRAVLLERSIVRLCAIAFVEGETILRIFFVEPNHSPVAQDFGNDRGHGNRNLLCVTMNDRLLIEIFFRCLESPIKQHHARLGIYRELLDRTRERESYRKSDPTAVDDLW